MWQNIRLALVAGIYGAIAGAVTALVLAVMGALSAFVWQVPATPTYIFFVIMLGGVLIAALSWLDNTSGVELADQVVEAQDPSSVHFKQAAVLAATAIIAVAFGGSVGPEAGIIAVVTELSAFVQLRVLRHLPVEQAIVAEAGTAGALAGLYVSPPGGAAVTGRDDTKLPGPLVFLAAVGGLMGLYLVSSSLLPDVHMKVELANLTHPNELANMLYAVLPALFGGLVGVAFRLSTPSVKGALEKLGNPTLRILVGTFLFALLAAALPVLRFSGHHQLHEMLEWGKTAGIWALLALALLKAVSTSICLASGWRGGAIFPLYFAGAAAGGAVLWFMPAVDPTVALIAGMVAASTVGMGKPIAAMLISVFMIAPLAVGPMCVGAIVGYGLSQLLPPSKLH